KTQQLQTVAAAANQKILSPRNNFIRGTGSNFIVQSLLLGGGLLAPPKILFLLLLRVAELALIAQLLVVNAADWLGSSRDRRCWTTYVCSPRRGWSCGARPCAK